MKKKRLIAAVMAFVVLMPMLMSCSSEKKGRKTVKEDDPWYESNTFKLELDVRKDEVLGCSTVSAGDDSIFSLYTVSGDAWASSKATLDEYDLDGNMISRKSVTCPDGFRVQDFQSVRAEPDGKTVSAAVFLNSSDKRGHAFVSIDTETGKVSNIKMIEKSGKIAGKGYGTSGIFLIGDYAVVVHDDFSGDVMSMTYIISVYKDFELINDIDLSSEKIINILSYSVNPSTGSLYVTAIEPESIVLYEVDIYTGKIKDKKSFLDQYDETVNLAEYFVTDKGDLCKIDSLGNISKIDINTMTPATVVDTNWYTPLFYPERTYYHEKDAFILSCNENRTIILDSESTSYVNMDGEYSQFVTVLRKADKNPHSGKEIIELALPLNDPGVSDYLARSVYEFNRTDSEYLIRVWDKYKTGSTFITNLAGFEENETEVYEMIQHLKDDDAPDIAVGIQKNYAMRNDVFMDLTGILDPEILNEQYGNILEAGRINGKLYFLPVTLQIEGLVTDADLLEEGAVGITFEDYDRMVKEDLHGFSPYDYPDSYYYNKRSFVLSCIDTKSAIDGEKIEFGTDQFRSAIEYAKDNFQYADEYDTPQEYLSDWVNRERVDCYYDQINDYLDFVHACCSQNGRYVIIGTPSVDASGPRFKALETISVSATTDVKDGCKKFINYLFSGAAYNSSECEFLNIVTNREIMNRNIDILTRRNNDYFDRYEAAKKSGAIMVPYYVDKTLGDKFATDDMRDSFQKSMSTISTYYYEDSEITKIVFEEITPYFAGDRSLDDVIKYLNDRTTKYIREM